MKRRSGWVMAGLILLLAGPAVQAEETASAAPASDPDQASAAPAAAAPAASEAAPTATAVPAAIAAESEIPELMIYSDEAMVLTATKHLQKLSEVPGSVTLITEQEIKEQGALTLREVLMHVSGTELTHEGVFESVRFRGMQTAYNSKILVLVDGRKVNTIDWGNFDDDFGLNLDLIRQIEIVKGPGSALYGANAFAGVVNIITKDGAQINGVNLKGSGGTQTDQTDLSQYYVATFGKAYGEWDTRITAGYWRELGFDLINTKPNNLFEGSRFEGAVKWKDRLALHGGYYKFDEPYQGVSFNPTPQQRAFHDVAYLDGKYTWDLNELSKFTLRLEDTYYQRRKVRQTTFNLNRTFINSPADLPAGATIIVNDRGEVTPAADAVGGSYIDFNSALGLISGRALSFLYLDGPSNEFLGEVQYDLAWPENNYLLAGASYTHDWSGQNYFYTETVSDQNLAAYIQDEYHPWDTGIVLAGLRYDYNTSYGSSFSPRGSLIWGLLPNLHLKALYGTAFRAPAFVERYSNFNVGFIEARGKRDLKPEQVSQSEVRVEYEVGKWLALRAAGFYWETANEIQPLTDNQPMYVYAPDLSVINPAFPAQPGLYTSSQLMGAQAYVSMSNLNARIGKGGELEVELRPLPYTKVGFNYCRYNLYVRELPETYIVDPGDVDLLNAMVGFNFENKFYLNFYSHTSHMPRMVFRTYDQASSVMRDVWTTQVDLSAGFKLRGINLSCTIFNLLEQDLYYHQALDRYVKGPKITRVTAEYTIPF